ncbi:MAG TPA: sulfite exporter TauE/SafE family protein, partial [Desulfobacteria bacterium]|nr:sulfite exporter TauE/SafE family protein [Desulfobacteria bacterium]
LVGAKTLYITFGLLMAYSALAMLKKRHSELPTGVREHPVAARLKLSSTYYDKVLNKTVDYKVTGVYPAYAVMFIAGVLSGLLGIGSGTFKVLAMDLFMKLPMKVSTATSNFMMGVTAAASAGIYYARGDINPLVAGPVAIGVLIGANVGAKVMERLKNKTLRLLFIPIVCYTAIEMLWKGWSM